MALLVCKTNGDSRRAVPSFLFDLRVGLKTNLAHHGKYFFVRELLLIKRLRIGGIEIETQGDAERYAVLRHHQIFWLIDGMMGHQLFNAADDDFPNILRCKTNFLSQFLQRFDGRMSIDVAGATLDANVEAFELSAQAMGEIGELRRIGKCLAKSKLSFENAFWPGEAPGSPEGRRLRLLLLLFPGGAA